MLDKIYNILKIINLIYLPIGLLLVIYYTNDFTISIGLINVIFLIFTSDY